LSKNKINYNTFLLNHDDIQSFLEFYLPYSNQLQPLVTVILRKFKDREHINFYKNCVYLLVSLVVDFMEDDTESQPVITSPVKISRFGLPPGLNIPPLHDVSTGGYYKSQTVYNNLNIVSRQINFENKLVVSPYPLGPGTDYMQSALDMLYTLNSDHYTLFIGYSTTDKGPLDDSDFHIGVSGKANKKEKLVIASLRETNEETGIIINATDLVGTGKSQKLLSKSGKSGEVLVSHVTITRKTKFGKINYFHNKDAKPRVIVILSGTKGDMLNALEYTQPFLEGENISEYAAVKISDAIMILTGIIDYNKEIISMEKLKVQCSETVVPKWRVSTFDFRTKILTTNLT